jgi:hypothetical protein
VATCLRPASLPHPVTVDPSACERAVFCDSEKTRAVNATVLATRSERVRYNCMMGYIRGDISTSINTFLRDAEVVAELLATRYHPRPVGWISRKNLAAIRSQLTNFTLPKLVGKTRKTRKLGTKPGTGTCEEMHFARSGLEMRAR